MHAKTLKEQGFYVYEHVLGLCDPIFAYDIVCLYAIFEHIPNVQEFLAELKRWIHPGSLIFVEMPNLQEPLVSYYDVPNYRDFFYRDYHLYYFSAKSLQKLLGKHGYECETWPIQVASLTNHFHWMHHGNKQGSTNDMVNVSLPAPLRNEVTPKGSGFSTLLDRVDDYYRALLQREGVGDILMCKAWLSDE
jgi:hypothetical protein